MNDIGHIEKLMRTVEDLHPDLLDWIETDDDLGMMFLRHPLMCELYSEAMNAMINERYAYKRKEVETAREAEDWDAFVWAHARPYRFTALLESGSDDPELIAAVWIDAESPGVNREEWLALFEAMPRDSLDELPDKFTIYRGTVPEDEDGISWTLDKAMAEFFAERFNNGNGIVLSREIRREEALYFTNGRHENEVIYNPEGG